MNIFGKLFLLVLICYGLYEYLGMVKRKFKGIIKDYQKLKKMEIEILRTFKTKTEDKLKEKLEIAEENARGQYQQKWDIINGLPTKKEIEELITKTVNDQNCVVKKQNRKIIPLNKIIYIDDLVKPIYDRQQNQMFKED